jgi:hypothetical protein
MKKYLLYTMMLLFIPVLVSAQIVNLPFMGEVDLATVSIPAISILLGALDGFNPCAMWVLIFLISMLSGMKDRKRLWILGLTFLFVTGLLYFFVLLSWVKVSVAFSTIYWLRISIAIVSIVGGAINLRKFFNTDEDGCEVVDDRKRSKIVDRVTNIVKEKSMPLALLGVVFLALSVNLIELACSAGFPLLFSQVMAVNNVTGSMQIMYTFLYVLFFLIDDLIIFAIAIFSFRMIGISSKFSKYSSLIGGIIMVIMGLIIILAPEWLVFIF